MKVNTMNKVGQTLYKMDNKGKIREWEIFVGTEQGAHFYSVYHGLQDGAKQQTKVFVNEGKNTGRKNATTAAEQCLAEAQSMHAKQIDRKGYTPDIPNEKPYLPMLAQDFNKHSNKIQYPAIVSPKIDGARLIIKIQKDGAITSSRTGKEFFGLEHITNELFALGREFVIDGELYSDTLSFQEIMSVVRKSKTRDPRISQIYFYAFDLINDDVYHTRVLNLDYLVMGLNHTKVVPWHIVKTKEDVDYYHKQFVAMGYEGTMVRNINSLYDINKRSYNLQKYKDFLEDEFTIVGYKCGVGKFENVPTFVLENSNNQIFEAVPRGKEHERAEYLNNAESYMGKSATVRYFELTDGGVPRFPVIVKMDRESYGDI